MSHEIDSGNDATPGFVFNAAEGQAWHGLGVPIPEEAAKDPRKIAELVGAAYSVYKAPVFFHPMGERADEAVMVPNRSALVRDDTHGVLEVLSDNKYNVVQPIEYFEGFRDSLAANHLVISSAGVLKAGRIIFVCGKFTAHGMRVLETDDEVETYVCMGGGYDGTLASFGYMSSYRTVCHNTLSSNLAQTERGGRLFRIPHSAIFDAKALGTALGLAGRELRVRADVFNALASAKARNSDVALYFAELLDVDPSEIGKSDVKGRPLVSTRTQNQLNALTGTYVTGPGADMPSASGTWWGALNAVTHYVDHIAPTRDTTGDGTDKSRFASAQFGAGAAVKEKALRLAMARAGIGESVLLAA